MSGEIIQLSEVMSMIFECNDLSQASVSISYIFLNSYLVDHGLRVALTIYILKPFLRTKWI